MEIGGQGGVFGCMARILVVEASPIYREIIRGMLQRMGHQTTLLIECDDCLSDPRYHGYDLVLADMSAQQRRLGPVIAAATPGGPPVIGMIDDGSVQMSGTFAALVMKPFDDGDLRSAVDQALDGAGKDKSDDGS